MTGLKILNRAGIGVYVSVGTERSFFGASMAPGTTHLLTIDIDENVVRFYRINTALLTTADNREEYLELRENASVLEWGAAIQKNSAISTREALDADNWNWWKQNVRERPFHFEITRRENRTYLDDDELFRRLHKLAVAGNIQSIRVDLRDFDSMEKIVNRLSEKNIPLSVLDISNAWNQKEGFLSVKELTKLLEIFNPIARHDSLLVLTKQRWGLITLQIFFRLKATMIWGYTGFTFRYLRSQNFELTSGLQVLGRNRIIDTQPQVCQAVRSREESILLSSFRGRAY